MNLKFITILLSVWKNDWGYIGQSFFLIFICIIIFVLTYYATKLISRARISAKPRGNICVIEVISVGFQNTIQLIRAGKKYLLIGVSKDRIVFLTEIDPVEIETPEHNSIINKNMFDKYLNKFLNKDNSIDSGDDNDQ